MGLGDAKPLGQPRPAPLLREAGFVIDLGHRVKPVITPDDPDTFENILRAAIPEIAFAIDSRRL